MNKWEDTTLGKYAKVIGGYAFKSSDFLDFGDYPVIKIKNIASGTLNMEGCQYISSETAKRADNYYRAKSNDILIAMTGSHITQPSSMVGRVARYALAEVAFINQRVGKIISRDTNALNEDFLYYFIVQEDTTYSLANIASGSANQANISAGQIEALPFSLPSIEEQYAIAEILSSFDDKIDLLNRQNSTLEALAQAYFRQWFVEGAKEDWELVPIGSFGKIVCGKTLPTKNNAYFGNDVPFLTLQL